MNKFDTLIENLNHIFDSIVDKAYELNYDQNNISDGVYAYMKENDNNFEEIRRNLFLDEFKNINIKKSLINYMYSVYCLVVLSDKSYENEERNDEFIELLKEYELNDYIFEELFEQSYSEIIDCMNFYYNLRNAGKKKIARRIKKDEDFETILENNSFINSLYIHDYNIKISEEDYLIEEFFDICSEYQIYDKKDISDYSYKLKTQLVLKSLITDFKYNRNDYYIKHLFRVIINNIYTEIHYSKKYKQRHITKRDKYFYNLLSTNELSFDELFDKFINEEDFMKYIFTTFYIANDNCDEAEIYSRNSFIQDDKVYKKVKTKYIDEG